MAEDKKSYSYTDPKTHTHTYYSNDAEEGEKIFNAFFGDKKKEENKNIFQKFFDLAEKHIFLSIFVILVGVFILFYAMSASSFKEGKCILIVPYFSHSTNQTCAGLESPLSNAIYLFIVCLIVGIFTTILRRSKGKQGFMDPAKYKELKKEFEDSETKILEEARKKYPFKHLDSKSPEYSRQFSKHMDYMNELRGKIAEELRKKYNLSSDNWHRFLGEVIMSSK